VYRPGPVGPGGMPLADFGERLLAFLLDRLILMAILLIPLIVVMVGMFMVLLNAAQAAAPGEPPNFGGFIPLIFIGFFFGILGLDALATYLYQVSYQLRTGVTVGKRVMKLRIVDAETGAPMEVSAARKRWVIQLLFGFVGMVSYLDGLWQLWDPQKQTLHDKVARTVVVKVPA
jgi:uncharacterized RDD family membrane protein YckC